MRRANESGSIYKLSGKRRKPWLACITTGWTDTGTQKRQNIGTYATKREAQAALDSYLYMPEKAKTMTIRQAYEGWKEQSTLAPSTMRNHKVSFGLMRQIHDMPCDRLDLDIMQAVATGDGNAPTTVRGIKNLFKLLLDYAFVHDCCPASRVELVKYIKTPEIIHTNVRKAFTPDEIQAVIDEGATFAVVLIFTGLRFSELLSLKPEDIHLDEQWLHVSKSKTDAGIRDVPIPDRLVPYLKALMPSIPFKSHKHTIINHEWKPYRSLEGRDRHECRHTYVSLLTQAGADQRYIKKLVGHAGSVTEDVYTHIPMSDLLELVNRVFNPMLPAGFDEDGHAVYEVQA